MKYASFLAFIITLGLSYTAGAVELSATGAGQALIYPIYNVESGNDTAIHVINTGTTRTVAKVRILEGLEGRVAYSFNLYLEGNDVWTGVLTRSATGARLVSADSSCTLPQLPTEGVELAIDGDPALAARARVGAIEVIGMSTWKAATGYDCDYLRNAFNEGGIWAGDSNAGLSQPGSGLSGSTTITNVMNGYQIGVDATALLDFSQQARQTRPEDPKPTLGQSETSHATIGGAAIPFRNGAEAVTALLTRKSAQGDFAYGAGLNAETDWVLTFPTKAYLNALTTPDKAGEQYSPFVTTPGENGLTCEEIEATLVNRDGKQESSPEINLCAITNIIGVGNSDILGGQYVRTQLPAPAYDAGWISLSLLHEDGLSSFKRRLAPATPTPPYVLEGLGMIGLSLTRIQNGDVGGLLSNYVSVKSLTADY